MRRLDPLVLIAAVLGVAGLLLLARALAQGIPVVYWGTAEERTAREVGRAGILNASVVVLAAGALLILRRSLAYGIAVTAVALVTATLTFMLPGTGWPWLSFLLLSPVALVAWIAAVAFQPSGRPRRAT
jgi:hypothetical protein